MRFGAVAQLGERELCKLEVVGSIPIGSTIIKWRFEKDDSKRSRKDLHSDVFHLVNTF